MRSTIALLAALFLFPCVLPVFAFNSTSNTPTADLAPSTQGHPAGIILREIDPGSRLESAGLRVGDIVTRVNGVRITQLLDWTGAFQSYGGQSVPLEVYRDNQPLTLTMTFPLIVRPVRLSGKQPSYPFAAKMKHISGVVVLKAKITREGAIADLTVVSGPEELRKSALDAVKRWKYNPALQDGQPIEIDTTITTTFALEPRQ